MRIRKYRSEDFEAIKSWYKARKLTCPIFEFFPTVGVIIPGIAVGFLMQTDTVSAILEPFVSNPKRHFEVRDAALLSIMSELVLEAKRLGYSKVFGFSNNGPMLERARSLKFISLGQSTTVYKDIK